MECHEELWIIRDDWDDYHGSAILGYAHSEEDAEEAMEAIKPRYCERCETGSTIRAQKVSHWSKGKANG